MSGLSARKVSLRLPGYNAALSVFLISASKMYWGSCERGHTRAGDVLSGAVSSAATHVLYARGRGGVLAQAEDKGLGELDFSAVKKAVDQGAV